MRRWFARMDRRAWAVILSTNPEPRRLARARRWVRRRTLVQDVFDR